MKKRLSALIRLITTTLILSILSQGPVVFAQDVFAQNAQEQTHSTVLDAELRSLKARLTKLEAELGSDPANPSPTSDEITRLKLELSLPEILAPGFTGLGPAASKVYSSRSPISLGGFGEVQYTSRDRGERATNVARLNLLFGSRFSKNLIFNSGFSFQGGSSFDTGGIAANRATVEYAYLDFLFSENTGLRVGNFLIPFGVTNLKFEPNLYPTVHRPRPEQTIIPATWHENGLLFFSRIGSIQLQAAIVNAGDIADVNATTWIRAGRQDGFNARAEEAAWVFRAEQVDKNSSLGFSFYNGQWGQRDSRFGAANVMMAEIHGGIEVGQFMAEGLYTEGTLSDTERIFAATAQPIGSRVRGAVLTLSYDVLTPLARMMRILLETSPAATQYRQLPIFMSWENENLQASRDDRVPVLAAASTDIYTVGVNYKPHPNVAIKADYAEERASDGRNERVVETGIAFAF